MHLPATVERRRRHSATHQPGSDRQSAPQSTMVRVEGSPVPVATAPAGEPGAKNTAPRIVVGVDGFPASVEALRWAAGQSDLTGAAVEAVISWDHPSRSGMGFGSSAHRLGRQRPGGAGRCAACRVGRRRGQVTGTVIRGHPAEVLVAAARGPTCSSSDPAVTWRCPAGRSARSANTSPRAPLAGASWSGASRIRSLSGSAHTSRVEKRYRGRVSDEIVAARTADPR